MYIYIICVCGEWWLTTGNNRQAPYYSPLSSTWLAMLNLIWLWKYRYTICWIMCQRYEQHVYKCLQQSATYKEKLVVAKNIRNNRRRIIPTCADILFSHCSHCSCCSHEASRLSPALRHAWQTQALRNKQLGGHHVNTCSGRRPPGMSAHNGYVTSSH